MSKRSGAPAGGRTNWLWLLPGLLAVSLTVVVLGASLVWAGRQAELPPILQPTAEWVGAAVVALWVLTLLAWYWPRRKQGRPWLPVFVGGAAVLAVGLGLAATARCAGSEDALLTPVWQTLVLFVGTSPAAFGDGGACVGGTPLGAQVARTLAVVAVFGAALAAALALGSRQMERLRARWTPSEDVVLGVDAHGRSLVESLLSIHHRVLVIALPGQDTESEMCRRLGARVVTVSQSAEGDSSGGADVSQLLRPYLIKKGRWRIPNVWIMATPLSQALAIKNAVVGLYPGTAVDDPDVRVMVRCDDQYRAEQLRVEWFDEVPRTDPLSINQATAVELIGKVARASGDVARTLVICDDTPLAEALLRECQRRAWQEETLAEAWSAWLDEWRQKAREEGLPELPTPDPPPHDPQDLLTGGSAPRQIVVVAPTATLLIDRVQQDGDNAQLRFHSIDADWRAINRNSLQRVPGGVPVTDVILTKPLDEAESHLPARLLSRDGSTRVHFAGAGLGADLSLATAQPYVLDGLLEDSPPEDSWTTEARIVHERYRRRHWVPGDSERRAWWWRDPEQRIKASTRRDNVDQVRTLVRNVTALGYVWQAQPSDEVDVDPELPRRLGAQEHSRWMGRKQGWTWGPKKDDAAKTHPQLKPWEELTQDQQELSIGPLRQLLADLNRAGFTPVKPAQSEP